MIADAEVFYWTPDGMQRRPRLGASCERYIRVADAEELLERAQCGHLVPEPTMDLPMEYSE